MLNDIFHNSIFSALNPVITQMVFERSSFVDFERNLKISKLFDTIYLVFFKKSRLGFQQHEYFIIRMSIKSKPVAWVTCTW